MHVGSGAVKAAPHLAVVLPVEHDVVEDVFYVEARVEEEWGGAYHRYGEELVGAWRGGG